MALIPFAVPYTPNNIPGILLDQSVQSLTQHIQDLERFLAEELQRIATAARFVPVQAAYGGILVNPGPSPDQPLDGTPTPLTGFNDGTPDQPNRVTVDVVSLLGDSLVPEEGGVYLIQCQISATIASGTAYAITVAINAVLSTVFGLVDAGNQTTVVTLTFYGLAELDAGDLVTLVASAAGQGPGPFTFIMESATFTLIRVSELHGRNAASVP